MEKKNVIVITDCKDVAFNEMKRIIESECKVLGVYDLSIELVAVEEFSIINAAFITRLLADYGNKNTVFSIVINPLKFRSARIFGRLKNGAMFFGANTGALTWLIKDYKVKDLYEIFDPGFVSFGGKFVHAPNIAKLVAEIDFKKMGKTFSRKSLTELDIKSGTIVHIDNFGLMKIYGEKLKYKEGTKVNIFKNNILILRAVYANRMMSLDNNEWVLYNGSSLNSMPELGCVRDKEGFKKINAKIGDVITWEKVSN